MKHRSYDLIGNTAIVNFPDKTKLKEKKDFAKNLIEKNNSIKTVLEKAGKVKGRLRIPETKFILGEKTKEVLYKENGCSFRFNLDKTYFSPRLSNERKELASKIKKDEKVLVLFAGVAPFSIVIAKNSKAKKVVSVEINREASKYAKLNVQLNKLKDRVEIIQRDVKKLDFKEKFDTIVMARPRLRETFLKYAFKFCHKKTRIFYYDFCKIEDQDKIIEKIKKEAQESNKKIKIVNKKIAGEIAPFKIRLRVDFILT